MTGSKVRVVVRARPTGKTDSENYKFDEGGSSVKIKSHNGGMEHFPVDQLIVNGTQEKVFDACTEDIIRACLEGYNGAILAYGQTGAGKTFTIAGGRSFLQRGIIPRTIGRIYQEVAARPENLITIRLSYVEIYNELMFDLLHRTPVKDQKGDLLVQEDAKGNVFVKGLSLLQAATEEQALNVYFQGDNQKAISEHTLNEASSRSHTVFTIYVESRSRVESSEKITSSKIHLVDLAGSERLKKTNSEGSTLKEAAYINKSLSYLEQVVVALANKQRDHVPYRQSRLTHFLKDSLGGNSKTTLIANIFPEARFVEETGSTLRFATRMMKVVNRPNVNIHLDNDLLLKKYERDIKDLRQELSMHDTLAGRGRVQYSDYTPDEVRALETKVTQYVEGESEHMEIISLKMVHESFSIMRKMIHALQKDLRERRVLIGGTGNNNAGNNNVGTNNATDSNGDGIILSSETGEPPQAEEGDVGVDDDATGGFGVGVAGGSNKPKTQENDVDGGIPGDEEISTPRKKSPKKKLQEIHVPDKQTSFKDWKERQGQSYEVKFQNLKQQLQNKRLKCKQIIQTLNQKKTNNR